MDNDRLHEAWLLALGWTLAAFLLCSTVNLLQALQLGLIYPVIVFSPLLYVLLALLFACFAVMNFMIARQTCTSFWLLQACLVEAAILVVSFP